MKPLNYKARDTDEIALGILKGMRFTGNLPTEAALGLNEFKNLKKD